LPGTEPLRNAASKPEASRGPGRYFVLLAAETAGGVIILWKGMPIDHEMMRDISFCHIFVTWSCFLAYPGQIGQ